MGGGSDGRERHKDDDHKHDDIEGKEAEEPERGEGEDEEDDEAEGDEEEESIDEDEQHAGYFSDCLTSENTDLVIAVVRVANLRHSFSRFQVPVRLREPSNPPTVRDVANVLTAAALRNNTCLEDLHAGVDEELQNNGAKFSESELQKLHAEASANLGAIMAAADTEMRLLMFFKGRGPSPWSADILNKGQAQFSAMRQIYEQRPEPDEMLTLYNKGASPALGSAERWDTDTRSGGLWMELPPLSTPPVALKGVSRPKLKTDCKPQDEGDLMWTWRAWHIMRVVFMHTAFLRGPCRTEELSSHVSVIGDADMKILMVQASSNLEKILQQRASLSTADFELWLSEA